MMCLGWTIVHINRGAVPPVRPVVMVKVAEVVRAVVVARVADASCKYPGRLENSATDTEPVTGTETSTRFNDQLDLEIEEGPDRVPLRHIMF